MSNELFAMFLFQHKCLLFNTSNILTMVTFANVFVKNH
jgi:hypothetical protein